MKKQSLEIYASELEHECFKMAYDEIKFTEVFNVLSRFQSHCNFNLFWLYSIAPEVVIHVNAILFLRKIAFKRKLEIKELIQYDSIITWNEFKSEKEFKEYLKQ